MSHPVDEATAVARLAEDRFSARLDPRFWGTTAAHGGYLGCVLLRAMSERVAALERAGQPLRVPRSLTVHFLQGPELGAAEVHTEVLRAGRKLVVLTARLVQNGSPSTFAIAAFGSPFDAEAFQELVMPSAPPPEACPRLPPSKVEIDHRFEHRQCFGAAPFSGGSESLIGGWSRLETPRPIDALTLTLLCDGWYPALFAKLTDKRQAGACPTVDLTIHFRAALPLPDQSASDYVLAEIRTAALRDGYLDEGCRIWSKSGVLLAQTQQHAVRFLPRR